MDCVKDDIAESSLIGRKIYVVLPHLAMDKGRKYPMSICEAYLVLAIENARYHVKRLCILSQSQRMNRKVRPTGHTTVL